jgi:adenylyltransferase/sulfurtransferase
MIDFKRFERQLKIAEIGEGVQEKWWRANVLIIGAGGLGCGVIQALASAGVGNLTLMDGDVISLNNLHRQWIYPSHAIGRKKTSVAMEWIKEHNSSIQVSEISENLTSSNAEQHLNGYDLWIDATDHPSVTLLIDEEAKKRNVPWVFGSAEQWDGQVSVFQYPDQQLKRWTYRDFFSSEVRSEMVGSCQERGILGPVVQLVAMVQAMEALKVLGDLSPQFVGKMFCWDSWQCRLNSVSL